MSAQTINPLEIKASPESVLLHENNLQTGILKRYRHLLKNAKYWHKFTVSNTDGLSRNEVLKVILDHVHPLDLIPVFYAKDPQNSNSYFFARNCESAIEKLCRDKLTIDHPYKQISSNKNFPPFKLTVGLSYANTNEIKIDVQKNVLAVLTKKFDSNSKVLNLDKFCEDPDLTEFCPLSQPKIMYFVLHIAKSMSPEELILSNNHIRLLNPLDVFVGLKLKRIDLSNNELASLSDLTSLKHFHVKELILTGNKLCDCDEQSYISEVKVLCPTVEILDNIPIAVEKFPTSKRYSLCNYDDTDLVDQFLEHFFTAYDLPGRTGLRGLYHNDAMFSLTCVYLNNQLSSKSASLKLYSTISRNLLKAADIAKASEFLYRGKERIMDCFCNKLPATEHDPYLFTADLMYRTDKCAVITVTGVYREKPQTLLDDVRMLGFTRTFTLREFASKFVITNEQLHVYNALTYQMSHAFLQNIEPKVMEQKELIPPPQTEGDYENLVTTLGHLTGLKEKWSKKCLEECSYDLKASLELFVNLFKGDKIPYNAFVEGSLMARKDPQKPVSSKPNPMPVVVKQHVGTHPIQHQRSLINIPLSNNQPQRMVNHMVPNGEVFHQNLPFSQHPPPMHGDYRLM